MSTPIFSPTREVREVLLGHGRPARSSGPGMFSPWREATAPPTSTSASISQSPGADGAARAGGRAPSARYMTSPGAIAPTQLGPRDRHPRGAADAVRRRRRSTTWSPGLSSTMSSTSGADAQLRPGQVLEDRDRPPGAAGGRRARAARSRRAARRCRARSSAARRPCPPRPSARASRDRARRGRSWRRSSLRRTGSTVLRAPEHRPRGHRPQHGRASMALTPLASTPARTARPGRSLAVGGQPPAGAQVADEVPVQRGLVLRRRSPGTSGRARGARCRRSSRRRGSRRSARSMPKFVPMPISPSRRAPSSVASARCRYVVAALGGRGDDHPVANSSSTPATSTPAGDDGTAKRILPLALASLRAGEDLAAGHVALAVGVDPCAPLDAQRQSRCPAASMRSSRARLAGAR